MIKVLENFYDGKTLYLAGAEVADDPSLDFALERGIAKRIPEEKPVKKTKKK